MSSNIQKSLLGCLDTVLKVKSDIGATLADVFLVTRTWSGKRTGDGSFTDEETQLKPTPCITEFAHDLRIRAGGSVKQGDLLLTSISRNTIPEEDTLRTDTDSRNVERFYKIESHYYRTIHISKKLVTWDVQIRKVLVDETEE